MVFLSEDKIPKELNLKISKHAYPNPSNGIADIDYASKKTHPYEAQAFVYFFIGVRESPLVTNVVDGLCVINKQVNK